MYVSALYVPGVHGGQKRVLDPPKLELQRAVNHHMGAGNQTQDPCRATRALTRVNTQALGCLVYYGL